jgi:hypothetical protein
LRQIIGSVPRSEIFILRWGRPWGWRGIVLTPSE